MVENYGEWDLYNPFTSMQFDTSHCFLCGRLLDESTRTDEHVFPKWLQQRYGLWNQRMTLLNRTTIPYKQMTVPCCTSCNKGPLSALEKEFSSAVASGYESFCSIPKIRVFQWLSKIMYGTVFKEMGLRHDRASNSPDTILSPDAVESRKMLHVFLQSVRLDFEWGVQPWSLFMFKLKRNESMPRFNYRDHPGTLCCAIQMDDIAVIGTLQDNATQESLFAKYMGKFSGHVLHPMQFAELVIKVFYKASLLTRTPKYVTAVPPGAGHRVLVVSPSLQGFSSAPLYDDWDQATYAQGLSSVWNVPFEDVFRPPNQVLSILEDSDGNFVEMDL